MAAVILAGSAVTFVEEGATPTDSRRLISPSEVAAHNCRQSVWVALLGNVYDLTDFLGKHPGGDEVILAGAGKDVTAHWQSIHKKAWLSEYLRPEWCLGALDVTQGAKPLEEHGIQKPKALAKDDEDVALSVAEDFRDLKKRMYRRRPVTAGETCKLIDALIRLQSVPESKDVLMERIVCLVEERADPNCTDQDGQGGSTPLLLAAAIGSDEQVRRLITAGADPLYKTENGVTALHKFASRRLPDACASSVLSALVDAKCNINAVMWQGRSPLHVAAQWGQVDMCRLLVDNGAMVRLRAGADGTPADWARTTLRDRGRLEAVLRVIDPNLR